MNWKLFLIGAGVLVFLPVSGVIAWSLIPYASFLAMGVSGLLLLSGLAGVRYLFAQSRRAAAEARKSEFIAMQTGAIVHEFDVARFGARWAKQSLDVYERIELAKAAPQLHVSPPPVITVLPEPVAQPALLADAGAPTINLEQARERGLSSSEQWFIGQDANGQPQTIPLKHAGLIAIGGLSGSGKTNTAAWLAAQVAAAGGVLYVCDPHYDDKESLSAALEPFSGAVDKFAVLPHEIDALVLAYWRIYDRRCKGLPRTERPALLLIDEFLEQVIGQRLSADAFAALSILAAGGRKKRMYGAVVATNWGLGAKVQIIRQSITHGVLHHSPTAAARFLCPGVDTSGLGIGEAYFFGQGEPVRLQVPELTYANQIYAGRHCGRTQYPYQPSLAPSAAPVPQPASPITAPPAAPPAPPTNKERIVALLANVGKPLTHSEIAKELETDVKVIGTEAKELYDTGIISRRACKPRRNGEQYEYFGATNQPTNHDMPNSNAAVGLAA